MYYCYILQSTRNNKYYIGSTKNVSDRLKTHNHGRVTSTKCHRPWILKYQEEYSSLKDARKRERQIKSWHSRKAIERLFSKAPSSSG